MAFNWRKLNPFAKNSVLSKIGGKAFTAPAKANFGDFARAGAVLAAAPITAGTGSALIGSAASALSSSIKGMGATFSNMHLGSASAGVLGAVKSAPKALFHFGEKIPGGLGASARGLFNFGKKLPQNVGQGVGTLVGEFEQGWQAAAKKGSAVVLPHDTSLFHDARHGTEAGPTGYGQNKTSDFWQGMTNQFFDRFSNKNDTKAALNETPGSGTSTSASPTAAGGASSTTLNLGLPGPGNQDAAKADVNQPATQAGIPTWAALALVGALAYALWKAKK